MEELHQQLTGILETISRGHQARYRSAKARAAEAEAQATAEQARAEAEYQVAMRKAEQVMTNTRQSEQLLDELNAMADVYVSREAEEMAVRFVSTPSMPRKSVAADDILRLFQEEGIRQ